ncbi:MAG: DUF697 domain-containing protein [bacterium]|nr:DUF697 domain-containing protein [bacterium]
MAEKDAKAKTQTKEKKPKTKKTAGSKPRVKKTDAKAAGTVTVEEEIKIQEEEIVTEPYDVAGIAPDDTEGVAPEGGEKEEELETIEAGPAGPIIKTHVLWALGTGLIPVPILDFAALTAVQLKMVERLAHHYGVPFSRNLGKSIILSLVGSLTAQGLKGSILTRLIKRIPVIGVVGFVAMSAYAGAATYGVGKIFALHFQSGGTLMNFDHQSKTVRKKFKKFVNDGKTVVRTLRA